MLSTDSPIVKAKHVENHMVLERRTVDNCKNPITMFGFLTPSALKFAQNSFIVGLELLLERQRISIQIDELISKLENHKSSS